MIAYPRPRVRNIGSPIQAHGITAAISYSPKPLAALLDEDDDRDRLAVILPMQAGDDLFHIGERKLELSGSRV